MKNVYTLNDDKSKWSVTNEELRKFDGFENISDEEAEKLIATMVKLALIATGAKVFKHIKNSI